MASRKADPVQEARSAKDPETFARLARSKKPEVLLALAENEDAPQEILEALVKSTTNALVRSAVAKHPATSLETLQFLYGTEFFRSIASNPILPLLKDMGTEDTSFIWDCIAKTTQDPEEMLGIACSGSFSAKANLASRVGELPEEIIRVLMDEERILNGLARDEDTPVHLIDEIVTVACDTGSTHLFYALCERYLTDENIGKLAGLVFGRKVVVDRKNKISSLSMNRFKGRRVHEGMPRFFLDRIIKGDIFTEWGHLKADPGLTHRDIIYMVNRCMDPDFVARHQENEYGNASNVISSICAGESLSPSTLEEVFDILLSSKKDKSKSRIVSVYGIARNRKTPLKVLLKIIDLKWDTSWRYALKNPSMPTDLLVKYARDERLHARASVAENPSTPTDILFDLAMDDMSEVYNNVARNPSSTPEILSQVMKNDPRSGIFIARHHACPRFLMDIFIDGDIDMRKALAYNMKMHPEILSKLANDKSSFVRSLVAKNPNCPPDILFLLSRDDESGVRWDAMHNPNRPSEAVWL